MTNQTDQEQHELHHRHHGYPVAGEIPVPHGPIEDESSDYPDPQATAEERRIFSHITRPEDTYTPDGTYWADLPWMQRLKFTMNVDKLAARQELRSLGNMIKKDPLSPLGWYFHHSVIPGAGLGLEGYVLFSIGNLQPLFEQVWPDCWKHNKTCSKNWIASIQYMEILGIMTGQCLVGVLGDWLGRRWGLIQDALVMFVGLIMLTAAWGVSLNGWVICYAWSLFFYSVGVGGEYPVTATTSLESAVTEGRLSTREDRLHRGRRVDLAFLMQGWGQLINQVVLIVLLVIFNSGSGSPPYSESAAQWSYRLSFAIPAVGTLWLAYYRTWKLPNASRQLEMAKGVTKVTGYDFTALRSCFTHFGGRLFATAGAWFCNDVFFYGNKLFQGQFISVISNDPNSLMTNWIWNLVNIAVELAGYYLATFLVDNKLYGRKKMQIVGFGAIFITFVVPAFNYKYYSGAAGIHAFQAMYFLSSFFNQFGPNTTTFLVAGEVFPTPIRATAHGFSACMGKLGALLTAVLYSYISTQTKFYVVPWFGLAGMLLTWIWLPDTTGLDLKEQERRWIHLREGKGDEYHGIAVHPKHLSLWERWRGVGKSYHPELDWQVRISDMRAEWEYAQASMGPKESESGANNSDFSQEIHDYFLRSSPNAGKSTGIFSQEIVPSEKSDDVSANKS